MKIRTLYFLIFAAACCSCTSLYRDNYTKPNLVDDRPTRSTKKLHRQLHFMSDAGFAIGHQDATSYGIGWKQTEKPKLMRSDVYDIAEDYPAVYGFDIGGIENGSPLNLDSVPFDMMRDLMIQAYKNGGIITISWHADNPVTGDDSWDQTPAVADILNKGEVSEKFDLWLDRVAAFLKTIKYQGKRVPIIFRPYHEMNGSWFWWGDPHVSTEDYVKLWKYTVTRLRDKHRLHNLLYTYSPNKLNPEDYYMKFYPGDDYVDILGIDIYDFNDSTGYVTSIVNDLALVKQLAANRNKLYAFTETGFEKIPDALWFTNRLYPAIKDSGIAWVLFWRNYRKSHHYMPYKGHVAEQDFIRFRDLPQTLFLKDIDPKKQRK